MRVLFSSIRLTGHLRPLFPYAEALAKRGHEVRFSSPESARALVEAAGFGFTPFDHPGDEALAPIWKRAEGLTREWANFLFTSEIFAGLDAKAALPALRDIMRDWKPDLVVRESAEFGALIAASEARIPVAHVCVVNDVAEEWLIDHAKAQVDLHRVSVGLAPDGGASIRACPSFTSFPKSLSSNEPVTLDRSTFRVRSPRHEAAHDATLPPWAAEGGRPLVYISLGTLPGAASKGADTYRNTIKAVATLPVRALLSTGGAELEAGCLGDIPDNLTVESWVDPGDIYPRADVLLCHGGTGTLLEGLTAGLPMVLTPLHADQPDNAELVEKAGAGVTLHDPDATEIAAALTRAIEDPGLGSRARKIATEIADLPDIEEAVDEMLAAV